MVAVGSRRRAWSRASLGAEQPSVPFFLNLVVYRYFLVVQLLRFEQRLRFEQDHGGSIGTECGESARTCGSFRKTRELCCFCGECFSKNCIQPSLELSPVGEKKKKKHTNSLVRVVLIVERLQCNLL